MAIETWDPSIEDKDTIALHEYTDATNNPVKTIHITGSNTIEWFKILLNRAMGNWDNAPWELKEFADVFIEGKKQQDYKGQAQQTITRPPKALHN